MPFDQLTFDSAIS